MTTNYTNAFITISPDTTAMQGVMPPKPGSIAGMHYAFLHDRPYELTSDELLFEVHALRAGLEPADRADAWRQFWEKPKACLRCSPLVKQFGWGLHHDAQGRVAAYGVDSDEYRDLAARTDLKIVAGMRSRRG